MKNMTYDQLVELIDDHLRTLERIILNHDGPMQKYVEDYNTFMQFKKNVIENARYFIEAEGSDNDPLQGMKTPEDI